MPLVSDSARNLAASLIIMAIVIAALVLGRDVLMPLALASLFSFILVPLVKAMVARRLPRGVAVTFTMVLLVTVLIGASGLLSAHMLSITAQLGTYKANLVAKARSLSGSGSTEGVIKRAVDSVEALEREIKKEWSQQAQPTTVVVEKGSGTDTFWTNLHLVGAPLAQAGLALLFTTFLLLQHNDLRDRVVRVVGTDNISEATAAMSDAGERLSRLFLTQAALNAGFGLFIAIALAIIGVPNAMLWGLMTALLRFVPFVGSFLAAIPPLLMAAAVEPGWTVFIATLLTFAIGEPLMGHIVEPQVLGKRAGLSPFSMVAAASFWTLIWGPVGLLLAAPITMAIVVLGRYVPGLAFLSVLLGDEPALSPGQELYHRILSGDAIAAAAQVESALRECSLGETADNIVMAGLQLAAADQRRGRLDVDQIAGLRAAMVQTTELITDGLPPRLDVEAVGTKLLLIPARGAIDAVAARFLADIIEHTASCTVITPDVGSGLTALADAAAQQQGKQVDGVVIVTAGGIEQQHLRFVLRRASRDFASARLTVLDWGREPAHDGVSGITSCRTVAELLGSLNCERKSTEMPLRLEDAITKSENLLVKANRSTA